MNTEVRCPSCQQIAYISELAPTYPSATWRCESCGVASNWRTWAIEGLKLVTNEPVPVSNAELIARHAALVAAEVDRIAAEMDVTREMCIEQLVLEALDARNPAWGRTRRYLKVV